MNRAAVPLLLLLFGCGARERFVSLPSAAAEGGSYVFLGPNRDPIAASPTEPLTLDAPDKTSLLTVFVYPETLETLKLSAGPLPATCRPCRLTRPASAWRRPLDSESAWDRFEPGDAELNMLVPDRAARCDSCVEFEIQRFGQPLGPVGAFRFGDDVLEVEVGGTVWRWSIDGSSEQLCNTPFNVTTAALANNNRLWLADGGTLVEVDPLDNCTVLTSTQHGEPIRALAADPRSEEVFVVGADEGGRSLARFRKAGGWHRFAERAPSMPIANVSIAWFDTEVLAAAGGAGFVQIVGDRAAIQLEDINGNAVLVTAIGRDADGNPVLGDHQSRLVLRDSDDQWDYADGTYRGTVQRSVHAIAPYGDNLLFTIEDSLVGQWRAEDGQYCPLQAAFSGQNPKFLVTFDDGKAMAFDTNEAYALLPPLRQSCGVE